MTIPAKIFQSITDDGFYLSKFIDCLVNENLYALVISGDPAKEDLVAAYNNITIEYNDALGDSETKMYATLLKEVTLLEVRLKKIDVCLQVLRIPYYDEQFANDLNFFSKTKFPFDISKPEEYFEDLDKCERISAGTRLRLDLKNAEFEIIKNKTQSSQSKVTKEYFYKALISLEDYSGLRLNADEITVFQFCERMRRFEQYLKDLEIKTRNGK